VFCFAKPARLRATEDGTAKFIIDGPRSGEPQHESRDMSICIGEERSPCVASPYWARALSIALTS